ncbi:MAG: pyridoxal-phosphate dependent enzyme [Bacteroidia bacterium]|nr:pyridoxal-phosphate dependent enzyme [Bacteroidia bacterium]
MTIDIIPTIADIFEAHARIKPYIHRTPVLCSSSINSFSGCSIFFKCENFQKVGAFKFRGACNSVLSLSEDEAKFGVATHSSGNHAAALALAARIRGLKAYIVMPENSSEIKKLAVKSYGAIITYCEPTLEARESTLKKVVSETGASFIHPYNYSGTICGQATAAVELIQEVPGLDIIMAPVGGGGLLSGTAIAAKALQPGIRIIAAEPENADDAYRSFLSGKLMPSINPQTIADGLLTSLGTLTFRIILDYVDEIVTVSETSIINAMRMIWERMKIIIEPSSAVPLAAILSHKLEPAGKKIGIIISGGNVDLGNLPF